MPAPVGSHALLNKQTNKNTKTLLTPAKITYFERGDVTGSQNTTSSFCIFQILFLKSYVRIPPPVLHWDDLLLLGIRSLHDQGRSGDEWRRLLQLLLAAVDFGRQGSADRPHVYIERIKQASFGVTHRSSLNAEGQICVHELPVKAQSLARTAWLPIIYTMSLSFDWRRQSTGAWRADGPPYI